MTAEEELLQKIQEIVDQGLSAEYSMHLIRRLLPRTEPNPIHPDPRPIATDEHGWPMLNDDGTAWARHDDPEQQP